MDNRNCPVIVAEMPAGTFCRIGAETAAEAREILKESKGPWVWTCLLADAEMIEAAVPSGKYEFQRRLHIETPRPGRTAMVTSCDLYITPVEKPASNKSEDASFGEICLSFLRNRRAR